MVFSHRRRLLSYKAARLDPPLFKVQGIAAFEPVNFLSDANFAMPVIVVLHDVTNNKVTLNDIHGNETIIFS